MGTRVLIALAVALASRAGAQPLWHAALAAPRAGLPAVAIDLGYAGPYVPAFSAPITLHANGPAAPFDGYIGFSFAVGDKRTLDTPVIARAKLRPNETWTFSTFATVRRWGGPSPDTAARSRAIVVEWRDAAMQPIARASAGVPAWSANRVPLRIVGDNASTSNATAFGDEAHAERAAALSDRGAWYAGFSSVVVPLATWLDLRSGVRDAIFGCGIPVVFVGFARADQQLDDVTRALLPVAFTVHAASYERSWPYASGTVASPVAWIAKQAHTASAQNPYIARTATASWVADEHALDRPLPSMLRIENRAETAFFADATHGHGDAIVAILAVLIAIASWLLFRRNRTLAAAALLIAFTAIVAVAAERVRPKQAQLQDALHASIAPGIDIDARDHSAYGPSPLPAIAVDRVSLTGDYGLRDDAEVRTADTAPSMGLLQRSRDWDAESRWSLRRVLAKDGQTDAIVIPAIQGDLHGSWMMFWRVRPAASDRHFMIQGEVRELPGKTFVTTFAIPTENARNRTASIGVTAVLTGGPVEIRWANGSSFVTAHRSDVNHMPVGLIPDDTLDAIARSGGVFDVIAKVNTQVIQRTYNISLVVQEKKS